MRRWTTPTQRFLIHGVELTNCHVYLTISQGKNLVTFTDPVISVVDGDSLVEFDVTQQVTSQFNVGSADAQINWVTPSNKRMATDIYKIAITKNLLQEEVQYGE